MPKALLLVAACLLLCGFAAAAFIATSARAQSSPQTMPVMVAQTGAPHLDIATPAAGSGAPPEAATWEPRARLGDEGSARAAGRLAYLQARLDLTSAQTPLFERWKNARLAAARRMKEKCDARMNPDRRAQALTPVQRLAREEAMLKARLADIGAERPALLALYGSLTDQQKARFDDGGRRTAMRMMRHMRGHGVMRGMPAPGASAAPAGSPPPPQ